MSDTEKEFTENGVDYITFRDLVEEITGAKFEDIFESFATQGEGND